MAPSFTKELCIGGPARWVSLTVMTYMYVVGELSHFLLGVVTRPMSQELHYGDQACIPNPDASQSSYDCRDLNQSNCHELIEEDNQTSTCVWNYSGLGMQYQVLAGPAFVLVFTTAGVAIGAIADRVSRKVVITVSCAVLTVATGLTGGVTAYWQLVILRMSMGAGESAFTPVCSSMLSDLFPQNLRALAIGIFNWGIYIGYGLSYAVGNFVTSADILGMGWRWSYIVTGIMGVVATLLVLLLVGEPQRAAQSGHLAPTTSTHNELCTSEVEESEVDSMKEERKTSVGISSEGSQSKENLLSKHASVIEALKALTKPPVLMLCFAACLRHTAGFSWAYNTQQYFLNYYPDFNLGLWVSACSIFGGSVGVAVGGFVSDRLVKRVGIKARLYILAGSQFIATPFAAGVLLLAPPGAMYSLLGAYTFAEMWFGVLFAVLLELVPGSVQSTSLAIFLFVMNNVGGNLPVVVDPLTDLLSYRGALLIMYPGGYLASSIFFLLTSFLL